MMVETTATDANDTAGTITQVVFLDQLGTEPCDYPMATARAPIKILFLTKSLHFEPIVEFGFSRRSWIGVLCFSHPFTKKDDDLRSVS
jgi:hypothetical protein